MRCCLSSLQCPPSAAAFFHVPAELPERARKMLGATGVILSARRFATKLPWLVRESAPITTPPSNRAATSVVAPAPVHLAAAAAAIRRRAARTAEAASPRLKASSMPPPRRQSSSVSNQEYGKRWLSLSCSLARAVQLVRAGSLKTRDPHHPPAPLLFRPPPLRASQLTGTQNKDIRGRGNNAFRFKEVYA